MLTYFEAAAEMGAPEALYNLGVLYNEGQLGVERVCV